MIVEIYNQAVRLRSATAEPMPTSVEEGAEWLAERNTERNPVS